MMEEGAKTGSKKFLRLQTEFFCGAIAALDAARGDGKNSEISPMILFKTIRGEVIEPIEEKEESIGEVKERLDAQQKEANENAIAGMKAFNEAVNKHFTPPDQD